MEPSRACQKVTKASDSQGQGGGKVCSKARRTALSQLGRQYACSRKVARLAEIDREKGRQKEDPQEKSYQEGQLMAARKTVLKNPRGGLTAAGREWFANKDGAHLKPGVRKTRSKMSDDELRRKGSWAVRFYGRKGALPPLLDKNGKPTRFALTAAAWGEAVPKTVGAARKIAAKGRRLLATHARNLAAKHKIAAKSAVAKTKGQKRKRVMRKRAVG